MNLVRPWHRWLLSLSVLTGGACASDTTAERPPTHAQPSRVAIGPDAATTDVSSLIGKPAPSWDLPTWFNGPPRPIEELRGSVVLVRWFMSSECPYCSATAPNLVSIHDTYADKGLTVVGMYHHKSETPLVVEDVRKLVTDHYRFPFPVAIDDEWKTLKRYWLDAHPESWTSVSFLIDRSGTVRFAHLGGEYPKGSADDTQMRAWIEELLHERVADPALGALGDATTQPSAIQNLARSFEDALVKDGGDRRGPTVKPVLDTFVPALTELCISPKVVSSTRSAAIRLLSATHDRRAIPCLRRTLSAFGDAGAGDVLAVLGAVPATRFPELADGVFHVYRKMKFSQPQGKLIGKEVTAAVLALVEQRHEEELLAALARPWPPHEMDVIHDEAFWQSVAARALGQRRTEAAVKPLLEVIITPVKGPIASTAVVALVKIGKPAVDVTAVAMSRADSEDVGTFGEVLGALGSVGSREHLLAQLRRAKDPGLRAHLTRNLTQVPRNDEVWAAYQKVFADTPLTLDTPPGPAKELLANSSSDLFDARVVPWLIKSTGRLEGAAEDVQALRMVALVAAIKVMKFEQIGEVETAFAKGAAAFASEFTLAKEVLKHCKSSVECYLGTLVREENQTKERQFAAIKAAFMIGVLGARTDAAQVVEALPKLTNPVVRVSALKALDALLPEGDAAIAARLDALYEEALKSDELERDRRIFVQAAARLRLRVP